jgi:hypothetical protein
MYLEPGMLIAYKMKNNLIVFSAAAALVFALSAQVARAQTTITFLDGTEGLGVIITGDTSARTISSAPCGIEGWCVDVQNTANNGVHLLINPTLSPAYAEASDPTAISDILGIVNHSGIGFAAIFGSDPQAPPVCINTLTGSCAAIETGAVQFVEAIPWSDGQTTTIQFCSDVDGVTPTCPLPPAPTPEPATFATFGTGLLALAGFLRHKVRS